MPITDLSAHQGIYSSVMTVGWSRWSRICTTTSVGCGCVLTSLAFPVCLRIPIVNCWDLMESITGHTDCTFWACIHWRRLVYGAGQSIVAKKRMHEAGWPGNWVCLQGGWFSPRCVDVLGWFHSFSCHMEARKDSACAFSAAFKLSLKSFLDLNTDFFFLPLQPVFIYIGWDADLPLKAREVACSGVFRISEYEVQGNCITLQHTVSSAVARNTVVPSRSLKEFGSAYLLMVCCGVILIWDQVFPEVKQQSFLNYNYGNSVYAAHKSKPGG